MASRLVRANAVTVNDVLDGHKLLEISCAEANDIPVVNFTGRRQQGRPGVLADSPWPERKIDQVMPLMRKAAATGRSQVVAVGVAQEYQRVFTGVKDKTATGAVWFSYNRAERRVTCYYF